MGLLLAHDTKISAHIYGRPKVQFQDAYFIPAAAASGFRAAARRPVGRLWACVVYYVFFRSLLRPYMVAYGPSTVLPGRASEATYGRVWSLPLCCRGGPVELHMVVYGPFRCTAGAGLMRDVE